MKYFITDYINSYKLYMKYWLCVNNYILGASAKLWDYI